MRNKDEAKLVDIVSCFYESKREELRCYYSWKVDYTNIPNFEGVFQGRTSFDQNIELKKHLNREFKRANGNSKLLIKITKYYIYNWGGIRTNDKYKIKYYSTAEDSEIISNGKKGVASWSKALTARDSKKYAIFDARVSVSLNGLIYKEFKQNGIYYPALPSRNKRIVDFQKELRGALPKVRIYASDSFYMTYLDLIKFVAKKCRTSISEIEMCLFAYAEEVAFEAFKNK